MSDYEVWEREFRVLFDAREHDLPDEKAAGVRHYLDQAEYEIAFEGFILALLEADAPLAREAGLHLFRLGEKIGAHREDEYMFDPTFWERFLERYRIGPPGGDTTDASPDGS